MRKAMKIIMAFFILFSYTLKNAMQEISYPVKLY